MAKAKDNAPRSERNFIISPYKIYVVMLINNKDDVGIIVVKDKTDNRQLPLKYDAVRLSL